MQHPIRVVIVGYGNVGRGVRAAIARNPDLELVGILSRSPERVRSEVADLPVLSVDNPDVWLKELSPEVAILCGGSKNDLPLQGPEFARRICTVDSFDNHSQVPEYFRSMDDAAREGKNCAVISIGWDPGIFSLERVLAGAFLPGSRAYGFYGLSASGGLSMGHSDALRTIPGVADARQYTHAVPEAMERLRNGENPSFAPGDMHWRECFVALEAGADAARIEAEIKGMPGYFAPYHTEVHFIALEELHERFDGFPHDGCVLATGTTGEGSGARIEYRCVWESNPEATGSVLVAYARAAARLRREGRSGAFTILDVPPAYASPLSREELLRRHV